MNCKDFFVLELVINYIIQNFPYNKEPPPTDKLYVEEFLYSLDPRSNILENHKQFFEILMKKTEVAKKLHESYDPKTLKPSSNDYVSPDICELFICYCLLLYFSTKDFKYMNCFLKLKEGILQQPKFDLKLSSRMFFEKVVSHEF